VPDSLPAAGATSWGGMDLLNEVTYQTSGGAAGYDAAGNVTGYQYHNAVSGRVDTYVVSYQKKDGYLEKATSGSSTGTDYRPATDTSYYDSLGERVSIVQHVQLSSGTLVDTVRAFAFDAGGQIVQRRDGTSSGGTFTAQGGAGTTHYTYVGGQQVGAFDEGGGIHVLDGLTAFSNTEAGTSGYVTQYGDTLKSIAQAEYGNASLWYVVAQANALGSDDDLVAGQALSIPQVTTHTNTASTFKPYDPGRIAGSTTPNLPYVAPPPPAQHCNALAAIIVIAVIVVATIVTAGAAAVAMGAAEGSLFATGGAVLSGTAIAGVTVGEGLAAAAIGGLVGNMAGQLVGDALGTHQGFSLREALAGGLTTAATAGVGGMVNQAGGEFSTLADGSGNLRPAGAALLGASGYASQEASNKVTGQPAHFAWSDMVASAVSAGVTADVGLPTSNQLQQGMGTGSFMQDLGGGLFNGALQSETTRLLGGSAANSGQIVRDAFGNALGNAAIAGIDAYGSQQRMDRLAASENTLLTHEQAQLEANLNEQTQASVNGDMTTLGRQADNVLSAQLDAGADARLMAYAEGNLGSGAWTRETVPGSAYTFGGTWLNSPRSNAERWYRSAGASEADSYNMDSLVRNFGQGLSDGVLDAFRPLGTFFGEEVGRYVVGNYGETLSGRGLNFLSSEEGLMLSGHVEDTSTSQFLHAVGGTLEGILEDPRSTVAEGYDYAVGKGTDWIEAFANWWDGSTPDQRAYGTGHFAGEQVGGYAMGEGGNIVLGGVGAMRLGEGVANGEGSLLWGSWKDYPKTLIGDTQYAQIGDRFYPQHAINRMQPSGLGAPAGELHPAPGRNISPNIVDYVIQTGEQTHTVVNGVSRTVHWSGNVGVVTENNGRVVVTILRRSGQ